MPRPIKSGTIIISSKRRKLRLVTNGSPPKGPVTLLDRLFKSVGCVVSYEDLGLSLGYTSVQREQRHVIRQYISEAKRLLAANGAPYVVAVAPEVGYALCEIAG